jgi:plasmid stabilization system protein ParE
MNRRLVVRPQAELDIIKHSLYLLEHYPRGAAFVDSVEVAFEEIAGTPRAGAILDRASHDDLELRFVRPKGFKSYFIIYQVTDDSVTMLRVLHGSQDLETALRADLIEPSP